MNATPKGSRKHIIIFGKTNSGKSSLINAICGQDISLVSDKKGTTTDAVSKSMELIPVGPVVFIDTAGLCDDTELGELRTRRTYEYLKRADIAIYVRDILDLDDDKFIETVHNFKKYNIPYVDVINKTDMISQKDIENLKKNYPNSIFISCKDKLSIGALKEKIINIVEKDSEEVSLLKDLVPYGSSVILVVPIDSEAPKGRLILPQVQCIRDCLDNGIKSYVVRDTELEDALTDLNNVDLVITDSQAFKKVNKIVPENIKLTSFSMLFARQKGDIEEFIRGVEAVRTLKEGDNVLFAESCTHNVSHEDIARVKIPRLLNNFVGGKLNYDYKIGYDFTENTNKYKLIIHCGGCMINRKTIINRIKFCKENNTPITNYGVILSFLTNTLDRSKKIFDI